MRGANAKTGPHDLGVLVRLERRLGELRRMRDEPASVSTEPGRAGRHIRRTA
jgi:hypothetical protein